MSATPAPNTVSGLIDMLVNGQDGNVGEARDDKTVNGYRHDGRARSPGRRTTGHGLPLGWDCLRSTNTAPNGVLISTRQAAFPTDGVTNSLPITGADVYLM